MIFNVFQFKLLVPAESRGCVSTQDPRTVSCLSDTYFSLFA